MGKVADGNNRTATTATTSGGLLTRMCGFPAWRQIFTQGGYGVLPEQRLRLVFCKASPGHHTPVGIRRASQLAWPQPLVPPAPQLCPRSQRGGSRGRDFAGAEFRVSAGAKKQSSRCAELIGWSGEAEFATSRVRRHERSSKVPDEQSALAWATTLSSR